MTTSIEAGAIAGVERTSAFTPGRRPLTRLGVRIARAVWLEDRAVAEVRWGAITLAAMGILSLVAKAIDPADHAFDAPIALSLTAAVLMAVGGWSARLRSHIRREWVRHSIGPAVLLVAMVSTGRIDIVALEPAPGLPLIILALSFAAITPGYPIAAALYLALAVGVGIAHAALQQPGTLAGPVSDEYVVRATVTFLAATGMWVVVRVAAAAEDRAARYAARSRRRVDDLERLERIVRRFDGSRSVQEVMQAVVEDVSRTFDIPLVSIYLPQPDGRMAMVGVAGYHSPFHVIEVGVGIIGRAAATRQTQTISDVLLDPDYRAARDDVRSEIAIPIVHDAELLGVINFEGTLSRPVGHSHVALGEMLGRAIGASLRAARLDEERRARLHGIERVLAVSRALLGDLDRRRMIGTVTDAARDLLEADRVLVARRIRDGTFRVEGDSSAIGDGSWRSRALTEDDRVAWQAIESGMPVAAGRTDDDGLTDHPTLALPIRDGDGVAAVLVATRPAEAGEFGALERTIGDLLATQVGVALQNADRHATVSDAAVRDPLTGLFNRRYFDEDVEAAFAAARRTGEPLSLVVLDLDRFSAVNNVHGHATGDAVLRGVAQAIEAAVRMGDTVARYGGEEFVIIAPGTGVADAVTVAERVRTAVASLEGDSGVRVTVSAGVASLLGDEADGQALFRAADSALLTAKRAGRDRVVAV